jgi:phosphate transport system permease protein
VILFLVALLACLALGAFQVGRRRALALAGGVPRTLHSHPVYHGYFVALWCGLPALLLVVAWALAGPRVVDALVVGSLPEEVRALAPERLAGLLADARSRAATPDSSRPYDDAVLTAAARYRELRSTGQTALLGLVLAAATGGLAWGRRRLHAGLRARESVERVLMLLLVASSTVAILTTVGIVLSLVFEAARFFARVPVTEFLFGLQWSPQTALRADQIGSSGAFGAVPVFTGTLLVTVIAMSVAVPVGFMAAVFLSEYAGERVRGVIKPLLEVLAGIPTVVYGFFAALSVGPLVRRWGEAAGIGVSSESALAAGVVMGVMIIPFVSSLSDDVIHAVPQSLREGSLGLGATRSETIRKVVVPAALPGIVGAVLLAVSRAIGETMIVVMAAGLAANLTANPLEAVTTVTVQIVTLLVGDQEFDSAKTLSAFALGLVLFCATLVLNAVALRIVIRYREQYE